MVSLSVWPWVVGDYASMVPIGSWVFFFLPWIVADLAVGRG